MISSGYTLDVYCDCPYCKQNLAWQKTATFVSDEKNPKKDCFRQMRKEGWLTHIETCTHYSPACLGGEKTIPKEWIAADCLTWSEIEFDFRGYSPLRFRICRSYIDPIEGLEWGRVYGEWVPTDDDLRKLGITSDMNWYAARPCLNKAAAALAINNIVQGSVTTVFYPTGYRPGRLDDTPYKSGTSSSFERGMAKIERMTKKTKQNRDNK